MLPRQWFLLKGSDWTRSHRRCKLLIYWLVSRKCTVEKSESVLHEDTLSITINVMCNLGLKTKKWVAVFRHNLADQTCLSNWREPNNSLFRQMWHLAQKYTGNRSLSIQKCFQYLTDSHWQIMWQISPSDFCIFSFFIYKIIFHTWYDWVVPIFQLKYPEYYSTSCYTDSYCVKLQQSKVKAPMCILVIFFLTDFISCATNVFNLMADQNNDAVNQIDAAPTLYLLSQSVNSWVLPATSVKIHERCILLISIMAPYMVSLQCPWSTNHVEQYSVPYPLLES